MPGNYHVLLTLFYFQTILLVNEPRATTPRGSKANSAISESEAISASAAAATAAVASPSTIDSSNTSTTTAAGNNGNNGNANKHLSPAAVAIARGNQIFDPYYHRHS